MKKGFFSYPINGTIESDINEDIRERLNSTQFTGPVKSYLNGDFTAEELQNILDDLHKQYPNKKFVFGGKKE